MPTNPKPNKPNKPKGKPRGRSGGRKPLPDPNDKLIAFRVNSAAAAAIDAQARPRESRHQTAKRLLLDKVKPDQA